MIRYFTQFIDEQAALLEDGYVSDIRHLKTVLSNELHLKSMAGKGDGLK